MYKLKDYVGKYARVLNSDVLKVDTFLNFLVKPEVLNAIIEEVYDLYKDSKITKILTIEASGIGIACACALKLNVPFVFAKKSSSITNNSNMFSAKVTSYTHQNTYNAIVGKNLINENENILIIDDFLATGEAMLGLIDICKQAHANVCGIVSCIEKVYQNGGKKLRELGYRVDSLCMIHSMDVNTGIKFD